jgi:hypothetical protein
MKTAHLLRCLLAPPCGVCGIRLSRRSSAIGRELQELAAEMLSRSAIVIVLLQLDFDVHARWEVEFHQRVDGLRSGVNDIEQALVRAHLELLA